MNHYLDNAATTRVRREAAEKALAIMTEEYGNPSSLHAMGLVAEHERELARARVAAALGCKPEELYFTSGGTEADNLAIFGAVLKARRRGGHIISSKVEHEAVINCLKALEQEGFSVTWLDPLPDGSVSPDAVAAALRPETALVSLMLTNNETGAKTDIAEIARVLARAGSNAILHSDCVQAFLKIPFSPALLGADLVSVSGHKVHAPKGVGALYVRSGVKLAGRIFGGGQERNVRPGTENMPGIAAFGVACERGFAELSENAEKVAALHALARRELSQVEGLEFPFPPGQPHILQIALPGYKSEVVLRFLESRGVYVSAGSACARGRKSHVLLACGLPGRLSDSALRISFCAENTAEDIAALKAGLNEARACL